MINDKNNEKEKVMSKIVVRVEKSGNRFNAWDCNDVKYTSQITTGARKKAYNNGMALEQRVNKSGKNYWWAVPMSVYEQTQTPVFESSVDVPQDHAEVLNFIHNSYSLKPQGLMMNNTSQACTLRVSSAPRSSLRGRFQTRMRSKCCQT